MGMVNGPVPHPLQVGLTHTLWARHASTQQPVLITAVASHSAHLMPPIMTQVPDCHQDHVLRGQDTLAFTQ
eukprot:1161968-Pelagomonas_calceolata.AAC.7